MDLYQQSAENVKIEGKNTKLNIFHSNIACTVFEYTSAMWRREPLDCEIDANFLTH